MIDILFSGLSAFEDFIWAYAGVPVIVILGFWLTLRSNFYQIRTFPRILATFVGFFKVREKPKDGVHPLKAFFACVGGCVGVGNIVAICTAVQVGGPGALFWIWITALLGMMLKYAEVYLGIRYRKVNPDGGYQGGPMYFIQEVTKSKWLPAFICVLLCIYGVEVYQFRVITQTLTENLQIDRSLVGAALLFLVLFAGAGGVRRVGELSSIMIPLFVVLFLGMGSWVLIANIGMIPTVLKTVMVSAFTPTAATGGFVGSTVMLTISQGVRRACYSSDVGAGYASVIHSESLVESADKQASLVIFDIFLDTFMICTMSVMLILVTGVWSEPMNAALLVQKSLGLYFPSISYFMPLFIFLLGYSTITAYFCVGIKCAEFISASKGKAIYYIYSTIALALSVYMDTTHAQILMSLSGGLLLLINGWAIFRLRKEIKYDAIEFQPSGKAAVQQTSLS